MQPSKSSPSTHDKIFWSSNHLEEIFRNKLFMLSCIEMLSTYLWLWSIVIFVRRLYFSWLLSSYHFYNFRLRTKYFSCSTSRSQFTQTTCGVLSGNGFQNKTWFSSAQRKASQLKRRSVLCRNKIYISIIYFQSFLSLHFFCFSCHTENLQLNLFSFPRFFTVPALFFFASIFIS